MRHKLVTKPVKVNELSFDDLYTEISRYWPERAARLRARRWRLLDKNRRDKWIRLKPDTRDSGGYIL